MRGAWGRFVALILLLLGWAAPGTAAESPRVVHLTVADQIITPTIAEYIAHGIARAQQQQVPLLITLDTPGGLLASTQVIVRDIMNATVPVIVYVAPDGARAASAGAFITLAAHVAAMAPSTRIGAAHPVDLGGGPPAAPDGATPAPAPKKRTRDPAPNASAASPLHDKIMADTVAWMRTIATARGRNVEWAVAAVEQSRSSTAEEALRLRAIDLVAATPTELLAALDGRSVTVGDTPWTLATKDATVEPLEMTGRQQLLQILANPNIAYILMMLGFYGLLFEITHPGSWVPGIAGALCLILAFYALHQLPTNYAGIAFIVLAILLFLAEVKIASYGLLTVAGLGCLLFGSLILIDADAEFLQISLGVILPVVASAALVAILLGTLAVRSQRARVSVGVESLVGRVAVADRALAPHGTVSIGGEIWNAKATTPVAAGDSVEIVSVEGMELKVRKV